MSAKKQKLLRRMAKEYVQMYAEAGALQPDGLAYAPKNTDASKDLKQLIMNTNPKELVDDPRLLAALEQGSTLMTNKNSARGILKTLKRTAKV